MSTEIKDGLKDCGAGTTLGAYGFATDIIPILAHINGAFHTARDTRDRAFAIGIEIDTRTFF
jgi:hypothetical protein